MTGKLELAANLEPFILIPTSVPVAEARTTLQNADAIFALASDVNHPQTLLLEDHLAALSDEEARPLGELLDRLPPLLVVDGEVEVLDTEDLKQFADLLQETKSPGLVVYQDNQVVGVIPRSAIARALPLTAIASINAKRLYGDVSVPARTFICRRCGVHRRPRQGDEAVTCPKCGSPMEREYL